MASFFVGNGQMLPVPFTMLGLKLTAEFCQSQSVDAPCNGNGYLIHRDPEASDYILRAALDHVVIASKPQYAHGTQPIIIVRVSLYVLEKSEGHHSLAQRLGPRCQEVLKAYQSGA